ncbi:hypothetical protein [Silicimonas sp. MF1-12-2]|uniref:carboxylate--amine ligase n=1 Tax=Silicimonas sp. MF1-12-2 TaxID=3384793 RepID=UPI0039B67F16
MSEKAIVLGGAHGGLAVTKSLQRQSIKVLVLTHLPHQSGLRSRHIRDWRTCPSPSDEQAFLAYLEALAPDWSGAVVFPTSDAFAEALSKNKERLSRNFIPAVADWNQAQVFLEKDATYRLADKMGIPHPKFVQPRSEAEFEEILPKLEMPVMVKPVHSHSFSAKFGTKLFICETEEDLRTNFARAVAEDEDVVICEVIPGGDYRNLETVQLYFDRNGEVSAAFCCIKLRQMPPLYGVIRAGVSMPPSSELIELGTRLVRGIDYRGYASVEFKRDPRDGILKLIEVNIRPLQMSQLPIAAGVDFPYITFQDLARDVQVKIDSYNTDMNYTEVGADIAGFLFLDKEKNVRRFLEPYLKRHRTHPYFDLTDPMPFLIDAWTRGKKQIFKEDRDEHP